MSNTNIGPKVLGRDKTITITEVGNGFIIQITETVNYRNGKTEDLKQVLVAKLLEEVLVGVRSLFEAKEVGEERK